MHGRLEVYFIDGNSWETNNLNTVEIHEIDMFYSLEEAQIILSCATR